eukprot:TRINITY_DN7193_c1_g1_i1.p1 TRINITY_DN7193_c1_g1~~TRINITY_DN7193_c1_g1_i1.p1  ORF type:complete len:375 (+),score=80.43 TRINITY_DN7193_c1_g1_i1:99-1223(+)
MPTRSVRGGPSRAPKKRRGRGGRSAKKNDLELSVNLSPDSLISPPDDDTLDGMDTASMSQYDMPSSFYIAPEEDTQTEEVTVTAPDGSSPMFGTASGQSPASEASSVASVAPGVACGEGDPGKICPNCELPISSAPFCTMTGRPHQGCEHCGLEPELARFCARTGKPHVVGGPQPPIRPPPGQEEPPANPPMEVLMTSVSEYAGDLLSKASTPGDGRSDSFNVSPMDPSALGFNTPLVDDDPTRKEHYFLATPDEHQRYCRRMLREVQRLAAPAVVAVVANTVSELGLLTETDISHFVPSAISFFVTPGRTLPVPRRPPQPKKKKVKKVEELSDSGSSAKSRGTVATRRSAFPRMDSQRTAYTTASRASKRRKR